MPLPKRIPRSQSAKAKENESKRVLANRYRVEKRLGSGNFGTAWLVTDLKCKDPKEQLKVLKEIAVGDLQPDETVDAMHEANLLRNLDHPGIVKFHDSFIENEFFCIVTEYCEGGDLGDIVSDCKKKKKNLPEALIVEWTIQLLLATQYMHSRRVMHRDLKARNIFLRNNRIKIGDFGISRILMGSTDMASTFTGTPFYMSPEVLKHEGYNSKSDVWSVGCILYELATHQHAFEGKSLMGVMYKIVEEELPEWPDRYSEELGQIFQNLLIKDPDKRPSAGEALKLPFIAKEMELIKNTMMDKHNAKANKDITNREANQLAAAMKKRSHLDDIKRESEEQKWRNMSPRERIRFKKQQKADEQARKLSEEAKKLHLDRNKQYHQIKHKNDAYNTHFGKETWLGGNKRNQVEHEARPITARVHHDFVDDSSEDHVVVRDVDEDDDDIDINSTRYDDDADIVFSNYTIPDRLQPEPYHHLSHHRPYSTVPADDRPITPMKNTMVYDVQHSSLDFKDGVPENPALAETYYSQFDEEFESDEESDEDDNEGTLVNTVIAQDEEEEDLINCMQNALEKSDTIKGMTLTDDADAGAFGPGARDIKIKNLKIECEKKLGTEQFNKAYDFLKEARFGDDQTGNHRDEAVIMRELKKIVKNPNDCFMVDQLLFLEEQAKFL